MRFFRSLLPLFSFSGAALTAASQTPAPPQSGLDRQVNIESLVNGRAASLPTGDNVELRGTPYAIPRWLTGRLVLNNTLPLAPIPLKYDVLHQRLLMRADFKTADSLLLDDHLVTRFALDEPASAQGPARTRQFRRFADAPEPRARLAYVEVLHEGRYALLKQYLKTLHKADYQSAYNTDRRFDEIEDAQLYHLRLPDGRILPVKLNLKSVLAVAPDLAARLKTNASPLKTEADWAAALDAADPR